MRSEETRFAIEIAAIEVAAVAFFLASADGVASFLGCAAFVLFLLSLFHFQGVEREWAKFRLRDVAVVMFCAGAGYREGSFSYFLGASAALLWVIHTVRTHDGVPLWLKASAEEGRKLEAARWKRLEESVSKHRTD
jgi:hypothetical protein